MGSEAGDESRAGGESARPVTGGPTILVPRAWTGADRLRAAEAPGRPRGRAHGGFVAGDLAALKKAILLCPGCYHKFDWKRHGYYPVWKYEKTHVVGNCDACKVHSNAGRLFLYEPTVPRAWLTKTEERRIRRHATVVGG